MAVFTKERPDFSGRFSVPGAAVAGTSGTTTVPSTSCTGGGGGGGESSSNVEANVAEVYFLIMHFLSGGPCHRAFAHLSNEVLQHKLLPRRFHALSSRGGKQVVGVEDDGTSSPLSYDTMLGRNPTVKQDHLVKLLEQLLVHNRGSVEPLELPHSRILTAADVPTLLGTGRFSLFDPDRKNASKDVPEWIRQLRWPHWHADQVHGLMFRELGGGYARHKQAPSVRTPSYVIVKPAVLVDRIQIIKRLRGHRNAVYCAIFDGTGRFVITGSDDRLVKLWSSETGLCLRSCRGHEGDITDLAVSNRNKYVASASNDFVIRVWSLPFGNPVSVLRGHTASVTAIAFSPRQGCEHLLLSSSDDGTCRIWDATDSTRHSRVYMPNRKDVNSAPKPATPAAPSTVPGCNQILCCAFNADGSIFVTGSSDKIARVWDACKWNDDVTGRPNYEMDTLKGHENDVNYVQFSGCAAPRKPLVGDSAKEDYATRFRNSWFSHDSIVTCSRDGTAIIWMPHVSKSYLKVGRWQKAYHLRVPPPPMPPQPPRGNGPRQRLLPTPRGVNMIVWSLDNRFVLAAIMDHRICVWNASDGSLVHSLTGHDKQTYVLDVHPINPRIAMSAGYDGRVIIWDIWEGRPIKVYETGEYNLVDGNFSPDGTSLVVSDEVGQIYIFGTGSKMSEKDVKYDQFFLGDFRPLQRDLHGNVLDVETQQPPHLRNLRDLLCDAGMIPYCDPYQTVYQQRRLAHLGLEWQPPTMSLSIGTGDDVTYFPPEQPMAFQPAVPLSPDRNDGPGPVSVDRSRWVEQPPEVEEAMDWEQDAVAHSEDTGSDYSASEESASDDKGGEGYESLSEGESNSEEEEEDDDDDEEDEEVEAPLRRSGRNKRKKLESGRSSSRRRVRGRTSADYDTRKRRQQRGRRLKASKNGTHRASRVAAVASDQEHVSTRPQRQAARNALNLFSTIQTPGRDAEEDESAEREEPVAVVPTVEEERGIAVMAEEELRTQLRSLRRNEEETEPPPAPPASTSQQPEVENLGDVRRPRSQRPRRIKIIFNRPTGPAQNAPPQPEDVHENLSPELLEQKYQRKLVIKPPKPVSQENGSTSRMLEEEGVMQEVPILSPHLAASEEIVVEENQYQWKKGKAIKASGSSKKDSESLESFERAILSNDRAQWEPESAACREGDEIAAHELTDTLSQKVDLNKDPDHEEQQSRDCEHDNNGDHFAMEVEDKDHVVEEVEVLRPVQDGEERPMETDCTDREPVGEYSDEDSKNALDACVVLEDHHSQGGEVASSDDEADGRRDHESDYNEDAMGSEEKQASESEMDKDGYADEDESDSEEYDAPASPKPRPRRGQYKNGKMEVGSRSSERKRHKPLSELSHSLHSDGAESPAKRPTRHARSRNPWLGEHNGDDEELAGPSRSVNRRQRSSSNMPWEGETNGRSLRIKLKCVENTTKGEPEEEDSDYRRGKQTRVSARKKSHVQKEKAKVVDVKVAVANSVPRGGWRGAKQGQRKIENAAWLLMSEAEQGHYTPQSGDEVAYLQQGHREYLEASKVREKGPWKKYALRSVEFCRITSLEYHIEAGGATTCKLKLQFLDLDLDPPAEFHLTWPELTDYPDFLVERSRFDAAMAKGWVARDHCKVWWASEKGAEEKGQWWDGRIKTIKAKSDEFPESPWEKYIVTYRESADPQAHSPWELFDRNCCIPGWTVPQIEEDERDELLQAIYDIEESLSEDEGDESGVKDLNALIAREPNYMSSVPVPLTLDLIRERLVKNFYRSKDAVQYDIRLLVSNAELFFGEASDFTSKMHRLSSDLLAILQ